MNNFVTLPLASYLVTVSRGFVLNKSRFIYNDLSYKITGKCFLCIYDAVSCYLAVHNS